MLFSLMWHQWQQAATRPLCWADYQNTRSSMTVRTKLWTFVIKGKGTATCVTLRCVLYSAGKEYVRFVVVLVDLLKVNGR